MNIHITSVNMNYANNTIDSVQVNFNAKNEDQTISIYGHVPLTVNQYEGNEALSSLVGIAKQELLDKITK